MKCPKCGIRAAKNAVSCFCGYEFTGNNTRYEKSIPQNGAETEAQERRQGEPEPEPQQAPPDTGNAAPPTDKTEPAEAYTAKPRFDETVPRYDKVGGWLLLLCVSLTILGPLATFYNLTAGYGEVKELFDATPGLRTLYNIYTFLSIGLGLFSLWAGFSLWTRMEGAVERAKRYLYAVLGYSIILYFLPTMSGLPEEMSTEMQGVMAIASFRSFIYVAIWYLYLTRSKRVRGTYPIG